MIKCLAFVIYYAYVNGLILNNSWLTVSTNSGLASITRADAADENFSRTKWNNSAWY
jgi:hypothetical protein